MKPIVLPASTRNGAVGLMIANVLVWVLKQFFNVDMPADVELNVAGIIVLIVMHFTTDSPPPEVAREAVAQAAADADFDADKKK